MLFAVVDIETTGSHAAAHGITEIAIVVHDGVKVLDYFESLVNPHVPIPYFIQRLTGIDNQMVANAASFAEIAPRVNAMLQNKIFVAHNVNFDYSFVKYHLETAGYTLDTQKLCTVRLSRKVLPGLNGYSLGKLTQQLGITHTARHRAGGDALATADLLALIITNDKENVIKEMLKGRTGEQYLPPHLPIADIEQLPTATGVYYFYNNAGKVIYVGKAKNIRKRVKSHFSNNKVSRQKQDFLKETHKVSYKETGTELMAHILESAEIRKLWPIFNRSQRGYIPLYGLHYYEDMQGYKRLAVEKHKPSAQPLYKFNTLIEGQLRIKEMAVKFELCPRLCNLHPLCDCVNHDTVSDYNLKVERALLWLRESLPTFALLDTGIDDNEHSCILIHNGNFAGMGYIRDRSKDLENIEKLKQQLEPFQDNDFIRNLVFRHAQQYPYKCVVL